MFRIRSKDIGGKNMLMGQYEIDYARRKVEEYRSDMLSPLS